MNKTTQTIPDIIKKLSWTLKRAGWNLQENAAVFSPPLKEVFRNSIITSVLRITQDPVQIGDGVSDDRNKFILDTFLLITLWEELFPDDPIAPSLTYTQIEKETNEITTGIEMVSRSIQVISELELDPDITPLGFLEVIRWEGSTLRNPHGIPWEDEPVPPCDAYQKISLTVKRGDSSCGDCGGTNYVIVVNQEPEEYKIRCLSCGSTGKPGFNLIHAKTLWIEEQEEKRKKCGYQFNDS